MVAVYLFLRYVTLPALQDRAIRDSGRGHDVLELWCVGQCRDAKIN
jgi:hypothetical protein